MPPQLPTLDPKRVDRETVTALRRLQDAIAQLEGQVAALQQRLDAQPTPLTIAEINHELSAAGSAPLNVTGLVGAPVLSP